MRLVISQPGNHFGPCTIWDRHTQKARGGRVTEYGCDHADCIEYRRLAAQICPVCGERIGYCRIFQETTPKVFVHEVCLMNSKPRRKPNKNAPINAQFNQPAATFTSEELEAISFDPIPTPVISDETPHPDLPWPTQPAPLTAEDRKYFADFRDAVTAAKLKQARGKKLTKKEKRLVEIG